MSEQIIDQLKQIITKHKELHPYSKRYPRSFWNGVMNLANHFSPCELAAKLGVDKSNLVKQIGARKSERLTLVELPVPRESRPCLMELQYSNGMTLKIYSPQ